MKNCPNHLSNASFIFFSFLLHKRVNPDCIHGPVSKLLFQRTQTLLLPTLFSLPWVLIISPDCRQKTNIRQNPSFEDLLPAVTLHCEKISVHFLLKRKKKGSLFSLMHGSVPQTWHYPHTALSFGPLTFFRILVSSWMVSGTWMGAVARVGVRGLAGDELTGYYWLCGGISP